MYLKHEWPYIVRVGIMVFVNRSRKCSPIFGKQHCLCNRREERIGRQWLKVAVILAKAESVVFFIKEPRHAKSINYLSGFV